MHHYEEPLSFEEFTFLLSRPMRCSAEETELILNKWMEEQDPIQFHLPRHPNPLHFSLGFISTCSPTRFEFTPMCPDAHGAEPISFSIHNSIYQEGRQRSSGSEPGSIVFAPDICGLEFRLQNGYLLLIQLNLDPFEGLRSGAW